MSLRAELSEDDLRSRWATRVQPLLFGGRPASERPTAVLIGGQPGCGKTAGLHRVLAEYPGEGFVPIIGDDLRVYHPDYPEAAEDPDETVMPAVTAQASGAWVRMGIEHAATHGHSVVVEGTFRNPETTLGTAARFAEAGHRVHVIAMAVPETMSRLSCLERYYRERAAGNSGRWTPEAAHDLGYEGTPMTVEAAENDPAVHRLTVMDRGGHILYDNTRGPDGEWQQQTGARPALEARRDQPLTPEEAGWWQSTATKVQGWAAQVGISPQAREAVERLSLEAANEHTDWPHRPHGAVPTARLPGEAVATEREAARLGQAAARRAAATRAQAAHEHAAATQAQAEAARERVAELRAEAELRARLDPALAQREDEERADAQRAAAERANQAQPDREGPTPEP